MSLPRLPFLYPQLFKQAALHENSLLIGQFPTRRSYSKVQKAAISTTRSRKQETFAQRYGSATEPQPPPLSSSMPPKPQEDTSLADSIEKEVQPPGQRDEPKKIGAPPQQRENPSKSTQEAAKDNADSSRDDAITPTLRDPSQRASELDASESHPKEMADALAAARTNELARKTKPLETVLEMGAPSTEKPEEHRAPHLHASPYVHHFDTFTLVRDLERGGFTEDQSVTIMKAVRGLLAINLDVAKEGLISKSDVENVRLPLSPLKSSPSL